MLSRFAIRTSSLSVAAMVMAALMASTGQASAAFDDYRSTTPLNAIGRSFETSRGPAYITGNVGSLQTTTLPGTGQSGLLMNNGNGTSTLLPPGGMPQIVATPR